MDIASAMQNGDKALWWTGDEFQPFLNPLP
jgi:hypothetical protein